MITQEDISIRTELKPGDIGYITWMHGKLYSNEYGYGLSFESYVAEGLSKFCKNYDPEIDRVWVCEHDGRMVGFLLLMHIEPGTAQLRYFLLDPAYRGIGLGKKLMELYMEFLKEKGYSKSLLWTTSEQDTAAGLYKRYGFKLTEEKPSAAFGKPVTEQRYDLEIAP